MVMLFFCTTIQRRLKFMFAFYPVFSTLSNAVTLSMLLALLKKTSLLASAPVVGVTIKSEYYRALQVCFTNSPRYKNSEFNSSLPQDFS